MVVGFLRWQRHPDCRVSYSPAKALPSVSSTLLGFFARYRIEGPNDQEFMFSRMLQAHCCNEQAARARCSGGLARRVKASRAGGWRSIACDRVPSATTIRQPRE